MEFKDYYKLLGVARDADAGQIKQAFRRLARKHHPDVNKAADAGARMAEVNEAYAVLSDAERRAAYDALGQRRRDGETFTPPPEWERDFEFEGAGFDSAQARDFSDFFANLSGRARKGGARRARPGWDGAGGAGSASGEYRARGQDLHARIELRIEDAFHAIERQITLQQPVLGDDGRVELKTRTLEVKIPRGVRPGQLIRLAGQGGPGIGGEPAGDVLLEVAFVPDARFRVEGKRLLADVALAPWEAALGTVLPVTLPDGSTLKVRVPEGAQDGTVLTVRGKGLPGATPGDLELTVCVILPSAMDPRARRAYEQMASELPDFDARKVWAAERERNSSNEEAR